jgi:hypothetical protein
MSKIGSLGDRSFWGTHMLKQLRGVFLAGLIVAVLSLIAFSPNALDIMPV